MTDRVRLLHVDDEPDFAEMAASFLERDREHLSVVTATDAADAMDHLDDVDCVVSDYDMPGTDGLTFLDAVRDRHPDLPFILYTAKGSEEIASEAISKGVTDYLQKETGTEQYRVLANRVENAVAKAHAEAALAESERRAATLMSNLPGMAYRRGAGPDPDTEFASDGCAALTGYDRSELESGRVSWADDVTHPDDREAVRDAVRAALDEQIPYEVVYRIWTRADDVCWVRERGRGVYEDDEAVAVEGFLTDVTDRKRQQDAIQAHREKIENLHAAALSLSAADDEASVFERTVDAATRVLSFDICVLDGVEDGRFVTRAVSEGTPADGYDEVPVEEGGVAGRTWRTGEAEVVDDLREDPDADPAGDYRSALSVPFGEFGVFQAAATETGAFDDADLELAELLCAHAAEAVSRLRSAEAVRRERDKFSVLFEEVPDPIVETEFVDGESIIRDVNPAFERTFGFDADEVVGSALDDLVAPPDRRGAARAITERVRDGERVEREVRRQTADGVRDFLLRSAAFRPADGRVRHYPVYTDITQQKEYQRRLNGLHEATRELMRADTPEAVGQSVVAAARDVLGHPFAGLFLADEPDRLRLVAGTGVPAEADGSPPVLDRDDTVAGEAFRTGETVVVDDLRADDRVADAELDAEAGPDTDADEPEVRAYAALPLGDHGALAVGAPTSGALDDADVDALRILAANAEAALGRADRERELDRQNRRLEEFASVVSHDLRGPLSVARGRLDLVESNGDGEHLDAADRALDRMDELVEDLLTLARRGVAVGETEPVALRAVAAAAWAATGAVESDATLEVFSDLPTVTADESRLQELLENLFRNAIEHAGPDAYVTVQPLDGGFYVADDGPGVPAADREKVFDAGYSSAADGTGFGLDIVRRIADAHGWNVAVTESEAGGARFEVTGVEPVE